MLLNSITIRSNILDGKEQRYSLASPLETHYREMSCQEYECVGYVNGFTTTIDERTDLGSRQGAYIRNMSGRHFTTHKTPEGLTAFVFSPGQECFFRPHRGQVGRPPFHVENVQGDRRVVEPARWFDDYNETAYQLNKLRKEG